MEYYSAIKENENLPFVTTWMNHEGIMLSEISHTEKDKYRMTSLICIIEKQKTKPKLIDAEIIFIVTRSGGWRGGN